MHDALDMDTRESSIDRSIEDDGCSQRLAAMDINDIHSQRTPFLGGWQSPLPSGHANIIDPNRFYPSPTDDMDISATILEQQETRAVEPLERTRKRPREPSQIDLEVRKTSELISQPTPEIIYNVLEDRGQMPERRRTETDSIRHRTRRAKRLRIEEPERDVVAVEMPQIEADADEIREVLEQH